LPSQERPLGPLASVTLASDSGPLPVALNHGDRSCQEGWQHVPLADAGGAGSGAVSLCSSTCLAYLRDPSARVVVDCPYETAPPEP
jgi:hypothetical protein